MFTDNYETNSVQTSLILSKTSWTSRNNLETGEHSPDKSRWLVWRSVRRQVAPSQLIWNKTPEEKLQWRLVCLSALNSGLPLNKYHGRAVPGSNSWTREDALGLAWVAGPLAGPEGLGRWGFPWLAMGGPLPAWFERSPSRPGEGVGGVCGQTHGLSWFQYLRQHNVRVSKMCSRASTSLHTFFETYKVDFEVLYQACWSSGFNRATLSGDPWCLTFPSSITSTWCTKERPFWATHNEQKLTKFYQWNFFLKLSDTSTVVQSFTNIFLPTWCA